MIMGLRSFARGKWNTLKGRVSDAIGQRADQVDEYLGKHYPITLKISQKIGINSKVILEEAGEVASYISERIVTASTTVWTAIKNTGWGFLGVAQTFLPSRQSPIPPVIKAIFTGKLSANFIRAAGTQPLLQHGLFFGNGRKHR
jgi:hypothetical protein